MERFEYTVTPEDEGLSLGKLARQRLRVSAALLRQIKHVEKGILLDIFTPMREDFV